MNAQVEAMPLRIDTRRPVRIGLVLVVVGFFGFLAWAALAPLRSAAIAPGTIVADSRNKAIQHLEGGIIHSILVQDGSVVQVGDPLVVLEDAQARAEYDVLRARFHTLAAAQARLERILVMGLARELPAEQLFEIGWAVQRPRVRRQDTVRAGLHRVPPVRLVPAPSWRCAYAAPVSQIRSTNGL